MAARTRSYTPPTLWYIKDDVAPKVEASAPSVGISRVQRSIDAPITRFEELARALGADLNAPKVLYIANPPYSNDLRYYQQLGLGR